MNAIARKSLSVVLTLLAVIAALLVLRHMWRYYMDDPWTRDAHINADVVQVAPDVSGLVTEVRVRDNALVHRGDVLFVVDPVRYKIALEQAQTALSQGRATLLQGQAAVHQLQREIVRDNSLRDLVAAEEIEARHAKLEQAQATVAAAEASIAAAQTAIDLAKVNLERTLVRSPVDGQVNDRTVRLGDYVAAGKPVLAVLDTASFRVDGYFEETRLRGIRPGQPVDIHVMGEDGVLHGHVQSIARGIEDRYRSEGSSLLPNVTPAFDWVRLAQRVPVRIDIDDVPDDMYLIAGRTATVSVVAERRSKSTPPAQAKRS
jgi:RND family efflux transporter MFP subunit